MKRCNIIAHRGASKYAPENTIPAFEKALEVGCDGFEIDVHCTKDGKVVVCHNYTIDETSDGKGKIADLTYEELLEFDFGSYFSEEFKGTKIPTLDEFLDLCADSDVKIINIEIKKPVDKERDIADKTIAAVKEKGLFDKLIISSFDPAILKRCKEVDPECKTGFLYSPDKLLFYRYMLLGFWAYAKYLNVDYVHPHFSLVNPAYVGILHSLKIGVNPWTVDSPRVAKYLKFCGCDSVITNYPDVIEEAINTEETINIEETSDKE